MKKQWGKRGTQLEGGGTTFQGSVLKFIGGKEIKGKSEGIGWRKKGVVAERGIKR